MMFSVWLMTFACLTWATIEARSPPGQVGPPGPSGPPGSLPPGGRRCSRPVDISFVIDASNSVKKNNFLTQIRFVQDIVGQLEVGLDKVHVAALTFAVETQLQFNFNEFTTTEAVVNRVGEIRQPDDKLGVATNTHLALDMMRGSLYSSKYARKGVPKINILLTDGNATDRYKTLPAARLAKEAGIQIIVIGIGKDLNIALINAMASTPADENVYIRGTFDDLDDVNFKEVIGAQSCGGEVKKGCRVPLDVAFLIDGSRSIHPDDFKTQITFVKSLVKLFDIGPDATHVAALTFSHVITPRFFFNDFTSQKDVLDQVGDIEHDEGDQTFTHKALEVMRTKIFSPSNGARDGVKHVCIVLTDGNATMLEETLEEAARARAEGIWVMGIGIGQYLNREELLGMVSPPAYKNTFFKKTFAELDSAEFQELVRQQACPDPSPPAPTVPADITPAKPECEGNEADVVFIVDRSSSIWKMHFQQQLVFLNDVVDLLDIGTDKTKVGMISFGTTSKVEFYLNTYNSATDINSAISASTLPKAYQVTNTHLALQSLLDDVLVEYRGARTDVHTICILITDGQSRVRDKTLALAEEVRDSGVELFVIGVGNKTDSAELHAMASKPDADYTFEVDSSDALGPIKSALAYKSCAYMVPSLIVGFQIQFPPHPIKHPLKPLILHEVQGADPMSISRNDVFKNRLKTGIQMKGNYIHGERV